MNELQSCVLDIFKEVSKICEMNDIPYYAIGGTCIGAVRHNGFIPWDDDLDIAIPIEHFSNFIESCGKQLPAKYELYDHSSVEHYPNIFSKIIDSKTTFIEEVNIKYPDSYKGVFIDVMPISGIPTNRIKKYAFIKLQQFLNIANNTRRFSYSEMPTSKVRVMWLFMKPINVLVNYDFWSKKWIKLLERYPLKGANQTGYVWSSSLKRINFSADLFAETITLPFETTVMKCPIGFDQYLRVEFGDYMQLPPIEERESPHQGIIDLNKSYYCYKDKI